MSDRRSLLVAARPQARGQGGRLLASYPGGGRALAFVDKRLRDGDGVSPEMPTPEDYRKAPSLAFAASDDPATFFPWRMACCSGFVGTVVWLVSQQTK